MARSKQERPAGKPAAKTSRPRRAVVADPPAAGLVERALGTEANERAVGSVQGRAAVAGAARTTKLARSRAPKPERDGHARVEPDLRAELLRFALAHPEGWSHADWMDLMERLTLSGYDTIDRDGIGLALENARVELLLSKVQGLGEKRRGAVLQRYGRLWDVQQASAADLAALPGITRPIASLIVEAVR